MISLGQISHPDEIIDQKAKVFYDYFHLYLSKNRYLLSEFQPLNNHLTILQKIDFRLHNSKLERSSIVVLKKLMDNELFDLKSDPISRREKYRDIIKILKTSFSRDIKSSISEIQKQVKQAIEVFNNTYDFDNTNYLDFCTDELISYLGCKCNYEKHLNDIDYYTRLIAAEFIRFDFKFEELIGINSLFSRLLSKEISVDETSNKIYSEFPLPIEIESQRENNNRFKESVESFLENRTLKDQFKGIVNYLRRDKAQSTFIVKIKNVVNKGDLKISYGEIRIVNSTNISIKIENLEGYKQELFSKFIDCDNCIFLEIPIEFKSWQNALDLAFREADAVLSYLSFPNQIKGEIDKSIIIELANNRIGWRSSNENLSVSNKCQYDLEKYVSDSELLKVLWSLDKLYFKAYTCSLLEDKIVNAWRYIELLGRHCELPNDEKRIKDLPFLLLSHEYKYSKLNLEVLVIDLISNNREIVNLRLDHQEFNEVLHDKKDRIRNLKNNTDYYFTNKLINDFEAFSPNFHKVYKRTKEQFEVLYEQRNYIIHQAEICPLTINLFISSIQIALEKIRANILLDIKSNNRKDLKDSLIHLIENGKKLIK